MVPVDLEAWSRVLDAHWSGWMSVDFTLASCRRTLGLDAYRWSRILLDEFHEVAHDCSESGCSQPASCRKGQLARIVSSLRADSRFGLTGTPEAMLRSCLRSAARLFRAECETEDSARRFARGFFRTNAVELD